MKRQQSVFEVLCIEFPAVAADVYEPVMQLADHYATGVGEMETELGVKREAFNVNAKGRSRWKK